MTVLEVPGPNGMSGAAPEGSQSVFFLEAPGEALLLALPRGCSCPVVPSFKASSVAALHLSDSDTKSRVSLCHFKDSRDHLGPARGFPTTCPS